MFGKICRRREGGNIPEVVETKNQDPSGRINKMVRGGKREAFQGSLKNATKKGGGGAYELCLMSVSGTVKPEEKFSNISHDARGKVKETSDGS